LKSRRNECGGDLLDYLGVSGCGAAAAIDEDRNTRHVTANARGGLDYPLFAVHSPTRCAATCIFIVIPPISPAAPCIFIDECMS
jgi:hypothetical protein